MSSFKLDQSKIRKFESPTLSEGKTPPAKGNLPSKNLEMFHLDPNISVAFQLSRDEENHIETEIAKRITGARQQAVEEGKRQGYEAGYQAGQAQGLLDYQGEAAPVMESLVQLLHEAENARTRLLAANERYFLEIVQLICKRIVLRELKSDEEYVMRLTKEVVSRINSRERIRIKISEANSHHISLVNEQLLKSFSDLRNLRVESCPDVQDGGCIVETDMTLIDATIDAQIGTIHEQIVNSLEQSP